MESVEIAYGLLLGCTYACKFYVASVSYLNNDKIDKAEKYFTILPTPLDFPFLIWSSLKKGKQKNLEEEVLKGSKKEGLERAMKQAGYRPR